MHYRKKLHIHFIGIGGIGMSGIAKILKTQGHTISGCDKDLEQDSVHDLRGLGCTVHGGNNTVACHDASIDLVVYSSAIKKENAELVRAREQGIPTIGRAAMLAELMRTKYSIGIAGSHGKTTTTSLVSHILIEAGMDPTVIVGGYLKNLSTNARFGKSEILVAEADESDRSLVQLHTALAVVTNINLEHLDTYKDMDDIKGVFRTFLQHVPFYGKAIVCVDDPQVRSLLPMEYPKTIKYGFDPLVADVYATDVQLFADYSLFKVHYKQSNTGGLVRTNMPGRHNVLNTLAALTVAQELGITFTVAADALQTFHGVDRRFTYRGIWRGAEVFDDYGHHPFEIENTLMVAARRAKKRVVVVFQPHRYTRTYHLWDDFVQAFIQSGAHHVVVTDIYAASEQPIDGVTAERFVAYVQEKHPHFSISYVPYDHSFNQLKSYLDHYVAAEDLLLFQGAGRIYRLAHELCPRSR